MRLVITTLALSLAAAVTAAPAAAASFERDGIHYEYSSIDKPHGVVLIAGHIVEDGTDFALRVRAGRVSGTIEGNQVDFKVPKATFASRSTDVASR